MTVVIAHGTGNVGAVLNMIRRIGQDAIVSNRPADVRAATSLILPGVGAYDAGMGGLIANDLVEPIKEAAFRGIPVLGICLGMQLLGTASEEGRCEGLGLIPARARHLSSLNGQNAPVPHMGWNHVAVVRPHPVFPGTEEEQRFYFAHSYFMECTDERDVIAVTSYGRAFPTVIARGSIVGCQFHPEKSHRFGLEVFRRFLSYVHT